jgi:V-type H+-transporting ATPase subunit G
MPPKQDNVARLLAAEERRNKLVADAKGRKAAKVKQSKADAERDVAEFRKSKDQEFENFRAQMLGGADSENLKLVQETDKQIEDMKRLSSKRLDAVASLVAKLVVAVAV